MKQEDKDTQKIVGPKELKELGRTVSSKIRQIKC